MTIELLAPIFGFNSEMWRLSTMFREEIFKSVSKSDLPGIIFTFVFAFNKKEDWEDVDKICSIFKSNGGGVYFIELEAELEERIKRNKTPNRLEHKPSKREMEQSEHRLIASMEKFRLNSMEGEFDKKNYIKINNTNLSPKEVAEIIKYKFQL